MGEALGEAGSLVRRHVWRQVLIRARLCGRGAQMHRSPAARGSGTCQHASLMHPCVSTEFLPIHLKPRVSLTAATPLMMLPLHAITLVVVFAALASATRQWSFPASPSNRSVRLHLDLVHDHAHDTAATYKLPNNDLSLLSRLNMAAYYQARLRLGSSHDECKVVVSSYSSDLWVLDSDFQCGNLYQAKTSPLS